MGLQASCGLCTRPVEADDVSVGGSFYQDGMIPVLTAQSLRKLENGRASVASNPRVKAMHMAVNRGESLDSAFQAPLLDCTSLPIWRPSISAIGQAKDDRGCWRVRYLFLFLLLLVALSGIGLLWSCFYCKCAVDMPRCVPVTAILAEIHRWIPGAFLCHADMH
mmetsp:Transcript_37638/g.59508  ORF Transcript_37638/g.59508 Transcript_37638/m.59508 type:complete len:164 (-) Transcript_37638:53-544(-)